MLRFTPDSALIQKPLQNAKVAVGFYHQDSDRALIGCRAPGQRDPYTTTINNGANSSLSTSLLNRHIQLLIIDVHCKTAGVNRGLDFCRFSLWSLIYTTAESIFRHTKYTASKSF